MFENYQGKVPEKLLQELKKEAEEQRLTKEETKKALEKLEEEYSYAKINPGEAIGMITAESFGEPGTQMSIAKNEKIILKIKNRIRVLKIGKFVDKLMAKYGSLKIDDSEILPIDDLEVYAPSLDSTEKVKWKKVVECSRHRTDKKLLKLTTNSGRSITATDNHSFVIRKDNKIIPVTGKELTIGERIPVIKYLPENCTKEIYLKDYMNFSEDSIFAIVEKGGLLLRKKTQAKPIPKKLKLNEIFGYFIGAYLAEGNATHGQVSVSNMDDSFINNVKSFVSDLGLDCVEEYHQRGFSLSRDLKVNSALFANFITGACKTGSSNKVVPEFSFSAKEDFVSGLLRGYFDGDGNFHVYGKMIRASTNSEELCKGISLLLTRFKIFSHKAKDKKGQYWLLIPYKYAPLFLDKIGSDVEHKRRELKKLAEESKKFWNNTSQDYTDMVSGFGDVFYKVAKKLGMRTRYVNNFTKRQKIGRTTLFRYIKLFEKLNKKKNADIKKELSILKQMFYSDVIWDEIVNIEYIENDKHVYDLSVPGLETFTTFDGIITHNTLNTFHFAGVAEVNVTLGLPRLIEILDARQDLKTPAMEVYLKKEYNKDVEDVKKVAASIKQITFKEVVNEFSLNIAKNQIEVDVNSKKMRELGVTETRLLNTLKENLKTASVNELKTCWVIKPKIETEQDLRELYKLKEKIKDIVVKGVLGIKQVMSIKNKNEFMIITAGSNLRSILALKEVDEARTKTNNIFEIAEVLGIEAARQSIINEAKTVIQDQGLDVDVRHIMLIADLMTISGSCKGITRSGITSEKESVLARASFETPIKHIMNAAKIGEEDHLNSVIENVLLNQPIPLGTGMPDLVAKPGKK